MKLDYNSLVELKISKSNFQSKTILTTFHRIIHIEVSRKSNAKIKSCTYTLSFCL